jgi:hypothetical protein
MSGLGFHFANRANSLGRIAGQSGVEVKTLSTTLLRPVQTSRMWRQCILLPNNPFQIASPMAPFQVRDHP